MGIRRHQIVVCVAGFVCCYLVVFHLILLSPNDKKSKDQLQELIQQLTEEHRILQENITYLSDIRNTSQTCDDFEREAFAREVKQYYNLDYDGKPINLWKTSYKCHRLEDFTDICHYENLCYNGNYLIFLDPEIPIHDHSFHQYPLKGPEKTVVIDWVYYEPSPYPPPLSKYVPYTSMWADNEKHPFMVNPNTLLRTVDSIEIADGALWFGANDGTHNIWHSSYVAMNLWGAQMLNETLGDDEKLPPQDLVYLQRNSMPAGWEKKIHETMVQEHSQFIFEAWMKAGFEPQVEKNPEKQSHYNYKNFSPKPRQLSWIDISAKDIICAERAVVISQKPRIFSGQKSANRFREKLFDSVGIPLPTYNVDKPSYSNKVYIDFRGDGYSRNLLNREEIAEMVRFYGLDAIVKSSYSYDDPVELQMQQLSEADVYIIVHGAGITNAIFMKPKSTVIELFPYGMHSSMFKYLLNTLDVNHIQVISWLKGTLNTCGKELYTEEYHERCQSKSNMAHNMDGYCVIWSKNACVLGPIYDLELALISAYDHLGINLNTRVSEMYAFTNTSKNTWNNYHSQTFPSNLK